jgi:predicted phosphodiesterase
VLGIRDPEPQESTSITIDEVNKYECSNGEATSTSIKIGPSAQVDERPKRLTIRPISLKVACLSDIHYPYQDEKAEEIALAFMTDYKPDVIVWNGDIFDFYAVSQYEKSISKKMDIQEEIDYGVRRIQLWTKELGAKTKHYFREGNHENRLSRLITSKAPALAALRSTKLEENVDFKSLGIRFIPDHQDLYIGNMLFVHGTIVRRQGGASARGHFDQFGCSVIMGHTHRLAVSYKRNKNGTHAMVENGTLSDFDVEYCKFPDWQHGFTTMEFDGDDFTVMQHPIINYKLLYGGKVYVA